MYGQELRHSGLANWKARLLYAAFGDTYPGHVTRFFVNRRCLSEYADLEVPLTILEIGSANGAFCFWLSRNRRFAVTGLDNDEKLVNDCRGIVRKIGRSNVEFILGDVAGTVCPMHRYDFIFASHVLLLIPDDRKVLANAFEYAKPGGYLILQEPCGDPQAAPSQENRAYGHVRAGYSDSDIRSKVESAGFELVYSGGCIGGIGARAYGFGMRLLAPEGRLGRLRILLYPAFLLMVYCEQVMVDFRSSSPPAENGILVVARRPKG
jgi:SAM-dependent methyltransferase